MAAPPPLGSAAEAGAQRPAPPRRATASRGRRGLAAGRSVERRGCGRRRRRAVVRSGRDVVSRTSGAATASRARCRARAERVTRDRTEAFWLTGGSSAPRLGIPNQINFPREIAGVQWKPLSGHLLPWTLCNIMVLWSTCRTSVLKSVTNRFIKNLACSGICASLVCVPFDIALSASPHCCWWIYTMLFCRIAKFLHKVFCSVTILSFPAIALDRYYSVLYPLERKISDAKSRDLVIYIWAHAIVASIPVFAVTNVSDIYAMSTCSESWSYSLGHLIYVIIYNITTVIVPVAVVFLFMILIRRALSASQKKKVIIAALRTPQNTISIPYASQREAELHAMLLSMVMIFIFCSVPYVTLVIYRTILNISDISVFLLLTAIWLPKVSLLANPLLFLTVNKSVRKCLVGTIVQLHRRYSRRNIVNSGGVTDTNLEPSVRSGSQLLEMFHIGQQQIFKPMEDEENETKSIGSGDFQRKEIPTTSLEVGETLVHKFIPQMTADSTAQVVPVVPTEADMLNDKYSMQFGFGPFELPPQWLSENRNSKKRLLPPLGNTPEELIQTKQPKCKAERKISRNNKVSIFPKVDS
ncbi:G-protein coupled receptor 176 isoform X1 [Falco biarmicus]|uniref:G-protein coupled receptor 176 isoform X1 n=2 Tax=Falco TaxID=8952 RepID=UPI0024BD53E3|nr:G-protein coupled receptor 176 isoform X1 [Falco biarmicus]